nr:phosphotransferase [Nocardia abscessus]
MESARAAALIEAHRPLLDRLLPDDDRAALTVREGQFHLVVLGAQRVVCLARTEAAAARLSARAATLRALAEPRLGIAVPQPIELAGLDEDVAFLLLTRIPGEPLDDTMLTDPQSVEAIASQCHSLLAALTAAAADRRIRALLPAAAPHRWHDFARAVRTELYPLMADHGRDRAERELTALRDLPARADAVVHGDLGGENLLWERDSGVPVLRGVVDWDGVCLGDPAEDLAALGAGYGADMLRRILAHLPPEPGLAERIMAIQGTFALQQALDGHRDGDDAERADGLSGYR